MLLGYALIRVVLEFKLGMYGLPYFLKTFRGQCLLLKGSVFSLMRLLLNSANAWVVWLW